jgi:DNA helicase-2/ATP-dependent DNA helicase PcrA
VPSCQANSRKNLLPIINGWLSVRLAPEGAGKTADIERQATRAAEKFGSNKVMLSSFTRAATAELVGRDTPIEREMIGTLHSFAFHALGRPALAEAKIKEWNADYAKTDGYTLTASIDNDEPESGGKMPGDDLYNRANIYRARMLPVDMWPQDVRVFHQDWERFKREGSYFDFTDLIEIALREVEYAPGKPVVGFFDEHQDVSKLEHSLVAKWGKNMDFFFITGDPDQALYTFKGSDPNIFLDPPTPLERTRLLTQSHRVPRQVLIVAKRWIESLSRRYPSEYRPRVATEDHPDCEGRVIQDNSLTFNEAERLIEDAEEYLSRGKTVMFIGSCGFHVSPVVKALRDKGLPFHNPYRRRRGDWNPLKSAGRNATSTSDRIAAFLEGDTKYWTPLQLQYWIPLLESKGVLSSGAKKTVEGWTGSETIGEKELYTLFADEQNLRAALARDINWMRAHLANKTAGAASYAIAVVERRGLDALKSRPKIIVGTVHSVKGGEADVVYLDPSLSPSMYREWTHPNTRLHDPIIRQFYVGMTRAIETLVVCNSNSRMVDIDCYIPKRTIEEF